MSIAIVLHTRSPRPTIAEIKPPRQKQSWTGYYFARFEHLAKKSMAWFFAAN